MVRTIEQELAIVSDQVEVTLLAKIAALETQLKVKDERLAATRYMLDAARAGPHYASLALEKDNLVCSLKEQIETLTAKVNVVQEELDTVRIDLAASQAINAASIVSGNEILKEYHDKVDEYNELLKCFDAAGENKSFSDRKIAELRRKITVQEGLATKDNVAWDKLVETSVETTGVAVKILTETLNNFARNIKNKPQWTKSRIQTARDILKTIKYTKPALLELEKEITFLDPIYITRFDGLPVVATIAPVASGGNKIPTAIEDSGQTPVLSIVEPVTAMELMDIPSDAVQPGESCDSGITSIVESVDSDASTVAASPNPLADLTQEISDIEKACRLSEMILKPEWQRQEDAEFEAAIKESLLLNIPSSLVPGCSRQGQVIITDPHDHEVTAPQLPTLSLNIMNDGTSEQPILLDSELPVLVKPRPTTPTYSDDENEPASKRIKLNKL